LWQIFQDDPAVFFSHFNIARRPLPPPETCRALVVSGTIGKGAADALLRRVADGRGWLAVLYLAFQGRDLEEEATVATIVRQFSLKTHHVRPPGYFYMPDFVVRWTPPVGKAGFVSGATEDASPLDTGLTAFLNRHQRELRLDPKSSICADGCRLVWASGTGRFSARSAASDGADRVDGGLERLRIAFAYRLDRGRPPETNEPLLGRPWDRLPITPPAVAATLRKECDAEMTIADSLESRVADAMAEATTKKLSPAAVGAIAPHLNALKRAGMRLQQCLTAAHENMRLQDFATHCAKSCNRAELLATFEASAKAMLKDVGAP
jgi:hypothetical protein